jgi:outer membrane protein
MKNLLLLFILSVFAGIGSVDAQKIGYVDSQRILEGYPRYTMAQDSLKREQARMEAELKRMDMKYQTLVAEYQEDLKTGKIPGDLKLIRENEIAEFQNRMQQFAQYADDYLVKKSNEMFEPIKKEIDAAIAKVAKAQEVNYVFEKTDMIFVDGGIDLTSDVRVALGMAP